MSNLDLEDLPLTPEQAQRLLRWGELLQRDVQDVPRAAGMVLLPEECPPAGEGQRAAVLAMILGGWP